MSLPFNKIVKAEEAIAQIEDGSVVAISGFNMATTPEYLIVKLFERYKATGHPKELFIISDTYPGAPGRGMDAIAKELYESRDSEFIRGVLMPYLGWSPWLQKLTAENLIEVHTWSIGIAAYWFREVASGRPGLISKVGLGTFLDPRQDGGALNDLAKERRTCRVSTVKLEGEEYLFYEAPKPDVALIRGTTSDELGNLTMEKEGIFGTVLNIAQAAKARPRPGLVIAQVERVARFGSLSPQEVQVPGPLIDYVVIAPPEYQWQTSNVQYDPRISGRIIPLITPDLVPKLELNIRKVIARRILLELVNLIKEKGSQIIVNLGIGIPALVANVAAEEGILDYIATTIESGPWGGIALTGPDFGVSIGPYAIIPMPDQFTMYEGGIIDAASLGFLQVDERGNVNPSMLPGRIPGPGGFSVIAAGAPRLYFGGGFTAGKRKIEVKGRKLVILEDGSAVKFVKNVYKIFFNGKLALEEGKRVKFITERAVFELTEEGLELREVAPGIDLERHVLDKMEFKPIVKKWEEMDEHLFSEGSMKLRDRFNFRS